MGPERSRSLVCSLQNKSQETPHADIEGSGHPRPRKAKSCLASEQGVALCTLGSRKWEIFV